MSEKTTYTEIWEKGLIEKLYKRFAIVVEPFESPLVTLAIEKSNEIFKGKSELSMFEIGAGSGKHTVIFLNGIANGRHISYTGIDVSSEQKKEFEEKMKTFPESVEVKEYVLSSWQEYVVAKKYDLVLAQHSWYGIREAQENFEKIQEILADGGVCFMMINSKKNISLIAMDEAAKQNGESLLSFGSEDLERGLTSSGLLFEKIRIHTDDCPREVFCKDDRLTPRGIDHFSYLFRKDLQGDEQDVLEVIKNAPDEAFRIPTDLFIVRK